ncbi:EF-hand domain-containing protein [Bradyrhizobium sp. USDA 336]|uniref:EF-hand domain-containing protein n=1 Tax=Bradyrhizobium sp. USDA 336 TaxID=3156311 RepID=UPI003835A2D8
MLFALGAVSNALDAIQSLTNAKSSSAAHKTGSSQSAPTNPFAIDSGSSSTTGATSSVNAGKYPQISAETMNALFAAQSQSADGTSSTSKGREAALKDLFSRIDVDGDGKITKSEFEEALGAGGTNLAQADDVFSKMDANADGSVNLGEMTKALRGGHGRDHAEGADSSSQPSRGSTSTTTTNADGSTTTTVTYADGFKMSTTVPGAASSSNAKGGGNSPYDWFGQMMQRQAQASAGSAASSMSISV